MPIPLAKTAFALSLAARKTARQIGDLFSETGVFGTTPIGGLKTLSLPAYRGQANANVAFSTSGNLVDGAIYLDSTDAKVRVLSGNVWISLN